MKSLCSFLLTLVLGTSLFSQEDVYQIVNTRIYGLERTKEKVVLRHLHWDDQLLTNEEVEIALKKTKQELENLEIFTDISLEKSQTLPSKKQIDKGITALVVDIRLTEVWTLFPVVFYSYNSLLGSIIPFALVEKNLFGERQTLGIRGSYNYRNTFIELSYSVPYFFSDSFSFSSRIFYNGKNNYDYDEEALSTFESYSQSYYLNFQLNYFYTKNKKMKTSFYSQNSIQEEEIIYNPYDKDKEYDNNYWLLGIRQSFGRVYRKAGHRTGEELSLALAFTPYYSKNHDRQLKIHWNQYGDFLNEKIQWHVKFKTEFYESSTYSPYLLGLDYDEIEGKSGGTLSLGLTPKVSFLSNNFIRTEIPIYNESAFIFSPISSNRIRNTTSTGIRFYLYKLNLPMSGLVTYNPLSRDKKWSFYLGIK